MMENLNNFRSSSFLSTLAKKLRDSPDSYNNFNIANNTVRLELQDRLEIRSTSNFSDLCDIVSCITTPGLVKDFPDKSDYDYDVSDFSSVAELAVESFKCLKLLIDKLDIVDLDLQLLQPTLFHCFMLCGIHHDEFLWSSNETVELSSETIQKLLVLLKTKELLSLLSQKPFFVYLLNSIFKGITSNNWSRKPGHCQVFKWLLCNTKHPHLTAYFPLVLPHPLRFIDHYDARNKILGIQCLDHIIDNVPPSELALYGRADVIYDALFHLTYLRKLEVVRAVYPCILKLLSRPVKGVSNPRQPRTWSRLDDVYHQLLLNMEFEDKIVARRELSSHVSIFIERLDVTVAKHFQRTKRVLLSYLSVYEGPEEISRVNALNALCTLIQVVWPRMEYHCESILKSILFLVYDIETDAATTDAMVKEVLLDGCRNCLKLLKDATPDTFQKITSSTLDAVREDIPSISFLRAVCEETSVP